MSSVHSRQPSPPAGNRHGGTSPGRGGWSSLLGQLLDRRSVPPGAERPQEDPLPHKRRFIGHGRLHSTEVAAGHRPSIPEICMLATIRGHGWVLVLLSGPLFGGLWCAAGQAWRTLRACRFAANPRSLAQGVDRSRPTPAEFVENHSVEVQNAPMWKPLVAGPPHREFVTPATESRAAPATHGVPPSCRGVSEGYTQVAKAGCGGCLFWSHFVRVTNLSTGGRQPRWPLRRVTIVVVPQDHRAIRCGRCFHGVTPPPMAPPRRRPPSPSAAPAMPRSPPSGRAARRVCRAPASAGCPSAWPASGPSWAKSPPAPGW